MDFTLENMFQKPQHTEKTMKSHFEIKEETETASNTNKQLCIEPFQLLEINIQADVDDNPENKLFGNLSWMKTSVLKLHISQSTELG